LKPSPDPTFAESTSQVIRTSAEWIASDPLLILAALPAIFAAAWLGNLIVKRLILRWLGKMLGLVWHHWNDNRHLHKAIRRLANICPVLIIMIGVDLLPGIPENTAAIFDNICIALITLFIALTFANSVDALNQVYEKRPHAREKPIKGYLQLFKIVLFIVTAILIISVLISRSPIYLLSGVGAVTAVVMLIFQDTILSMVASVQISSGNLVRIGDWIEVPNLNADGDVIDIALHTVKVQNWDKTITTFPTRRLITDPFKNWRGMRESGGRRIKRPIYLDQGSIHFLTPEETERLRRFSLLHGYLEEKEEEIAEWNRQLGSQGKAEINRRRITNIGTFRAYVMRYLKSHPRIHQGMTMLVRQLNPTPNGLPLEIYCFTNTVLWAGYEDAQSDLFDHLLAILPEFGLRVFQNPSGDDFRKLAVTGPAAESAGPV